MKKHYPEKVFPLSQRDLAAYLGISVTLLNMTETGRHGERRLCGKPSKKMAELLVAHQQSQKLNTHGISIKRMEISSANDCARLAKVMRLDADHADAHVAILNRRLDEMVSKAKQDMHWIKTVDLLLATLPKTRESAKDSIWLQNQQEIVLERLQKNGWLAQVKLEAQIETKKERARVCRNVLKKLLKK